MESPVSLISRSLITSLQIWSVLLGGAMMQRQSFLGYPTGYPVEVRFPVDVLKKPLQSSNINRDYRNILIEMLSIQDFHFALFHISTNRGLHTKALYMSPDSRTSTRTDICTLLDMLLPTITLKIYHLDNVMATGGVSWSSDHMGRCLS